MTTLSFGRLCNLAEELANAPGGQRREVGDPEKVRSML